MQGIYMLFGYLTAGTSSKLMNEWVLSLEDFD